MRGARGNSRSYRDWYSRALAHFDDRRFRARHAVAVDGEAGIILPYDHRAERVSHQATHPAQADIPGNVTFELRWPEAEAA